VRFLLVFVSFWSVFRGFLQFLGGLEARFCAGKMVKLNHE